MECCRSKPGYKLLSIISIAEGDALALSMEKDPEMEYKVRGIINGVWVGAMRSMNGKFNYFELDGSPNFTLGNGYSRFLDGGGDCLTFSVDVRLSFVLRGEGCLGTRGVVCEKKVTLRDSADIKFVDVGNRYFYSTTSMSHADANMTCRNNRMRLVEVFDKEKLGVIIDGISQFRNHTTYLSGFWTGHKHYTIPLHDLPHSQTSFYLQYPWKIRELHEMHHGVEEYAGVTDDPPQCHESFWMDIRGEVVLEQWKRKCSRVLNFVCEVVGNGDGGDVSEEFFGGNSDFEREFRELGECGGMPSGVVEFPIWVSSGEATWYQARECCSRLTPGHTFELVSMDEISLKHILDDHILANVGLYDKISGLGFWTSGSNIVRDRFAWLSNTYSFIQEDGFYNGYAANDTEDHTVCLQVFYSNVDGGLRVVGKGCDEKTQYVCGRKFDSSMEYAPCDKVLYDRIGESSFFLSWDRMPWLRAADCCAQRSSVLAKVATKQESAYVARSLLSLLNSYNTSGTNLIDHGAWIGPQNLTWMDETTFNAESYQHQHGYDDGNYPGQDGSGEKCVGVFASADQKGGLVWKVLGCHEKLWSICHTDVDAEGKADWQLE